MIFYITVLRAISAMIITNAHYVGVYPTDMIANGGLLGDVIFFAVSGFCLCNVKDVPFTQWYSRRLFRIYPAVIVITAVYMLLGFYEEPKNFFDAINWFVYPTYYHFIASIVVLYIPFYFVAKRTQTDRKFIPKVFWSVVAVWLLVYVFLYDKSYYHIDVVREPMIRFLFFEAMLLGAWCRVYREKCMDNGFWKMDACGLIILLPIYFASKIAFSKYEALRNFQILNQFVLILLLYFLMRFFGRIDKKLSLLPGIIKKVIVFISEITLEIYLVQYVIIPRFAERFVFPLNWIMITATILITAVILHVFIKKTTVLCEKLTKTRGKSLI